jgi:hypothetical protein
VEPRHVGLKKEAFEIEPMRQSTLIHLLPIYICFLLQFNPFTSNLHMLFASIFFKIVQ